MSLGFEQKERLKVIESFTNRAWEKPKTALEKADKAVKNYDILGLSYHIIDNKRYGDWLAYTEKVERASKMKEALQSAISEQQAEIDRLKKSHDYLLKRFKQFHEHSNESASYMGYCHDSTKCEECKAIREAEEL